MSLRGRLKRVERLLAGEHVIPQCRTCGYPRRELGPISVCHGPQPERHCVSCGQLVDPDGRTLLTLLGTRGTVEMQITLHERNASLTDLPR